ncbi:hypothetical protein MUN89_17900 [Halobacillus salinarum]|uniref:Uncharacterized protein n=1 Tax=Halobacillus salinarum TaxID=2932257 RepID=A0ABY4ENQ3_9BACI|nr:hypothetical protein [Halobacillus salinarum]UOQ43736.1 hypothetical protein MUN89_17900 [Halobacillus salinarum]
MNKSKDIHSDIKIERLSETKDIYEISDVFLFIASSGIIFNINFLIALPTPTKFSLNVILNEIAPHFHKVQLIKTNDNITTINLKFLKTHSQELLNKALDEQSPDSIINDIYRTNKLYKIPKHGLNLKYYKVHCEYIQPVTLQNFDRVMDFIDSSFLKSGEPFSLRTSGWILEEELKNSIAIRAFSSFSKEIILVVNSADDTVVFVDIYK